MSQIEGSACLGETLRGFSEERQCRARALVRVDGSVDVRCAAENFTFFQPRISATGPAPRHLALYGDFRGIEIRSDDHQGMDVHFWGDAISFEAWGSVALHVAGNVSRLATDGTAHLAGIFGSVESTHAAQFEGKGYFGNVSVRAVDVRLTARPVGRATFTFQGSDVLLWLVEHRSYGIDVYLPAGWGYFDYGPNLTRMSSDPTGPQHYRQPQPTVASDHLTIIGASPRGERRGEVQLYAQ